MSFINPNTEEERILLPFQPGLTLGTESSLDSSAGHLYSRFTLRRCSLLTGDLRDLGSGPGWEQQGGALKRPVEIQERGTCSRLWSRDGGFLCFLLGEDASHI